MKTPLLSSFHGIDAEMLMRRYAEQALALQRDPWCDLPTWVRDDPAHCLAGRKVMVCGSKMPGEMRFLAERCEIVGVVDDFLWRSRADCMGLPVYSTDEWIDMARADPAMVSIVGVATVVGDDHFGRIVAQHNLRALRMLDAFRILAEGIDRLSGHGNVFVYGVPFFRHAVQNADEHLRCARLLDDEFSRFTYFSILNYRLNADPRFLQRCAVGHNTERPRYNSYLFDRASIELSDDEVFVDGGAFDGDSVEQFLRAVNGRFRHVYSFEPSPDTAARCRERILRLQSQYLPEITSRISVIERGLWDKEARLLFNPTQYGPRETAMAAHSPLAGHVIEAGMTQHLYAPEDENPGSFSIHTVAIDEVCDEPVSLLKLEVEGSELKALEGARQTITRHRPKMAISVYHKPEDLITLPDFVAQTGHGYRMSLRQHNPYVPDAMVCYCV